MKSYSTGLLLEEESLFASIYKKRFLIAGLLVLLHFFFKLFNLSDYSLWYDESFSVFHGQGDFQYIRNVSKWDINPPFYNMVLHYWMKVFGVSESSVRISSVFFNSLSAGLLFLFASRFLNVQAAIYASILYFASNDVYYYAMEARAYSMILFLSLASGYMFLSLLEKPRIWKLLLLGSLNFSLIYTHYLMGFLLLSQGIVSLIHFRKPAFYYYLGSYIVFILLLFHWKGRIIEILTSKASGFWLGKPTFDDLKNFFIEFANSKTLLFIHAAILLCGIILLLARWKKIQVSPPLRTTILYVFLTGIGIILLDYAIAIWYVPVFLKRYLLYTFPGTILLYGFIVSLIPVTFRIKVLLISLLGIAAFLQIQPNLSKGMDYKHAIPFVKSHQDSNTVIVLQTIDVGALFAYYYDRDIFMDYRNVTENLKKKNVFIMNDSTWMKDFDLTPFDKVILAQTYESAPDPNGTLYTYLDNRFAFKEKKTDFEGITITFFEKEH